MIVVLFFLFTYGDNVFGSSRWLDLGFIRIQPSELAKPIIMLWTAKQLSNNDIIQKDIHRVWKAIFLPGLATVLIFLQPDFGTAATVSFIVLIQMMFSKVKLVYPLIISFVGSLIASIFVTSEFYRVEGLEFGVKEYAIKGKNC